MAAHVVANTNTDAAPPAPPAGHDYIFEMVYDGGNQRAWADSITDLIDLIVPGYSGLDSEEARLVARYDLAVQVASALQVSIFNDDRFAGAVTDEIRAIAATPLNPPDITVWEQPVPLVVIDTHHRPYTPRALPRQAPGAQPVLVVATIDEEAFMASLHAAGFIVLAVRD